MSRYAIVALSLLAASTFGALAEPGDADAPPDLRESVCLMIESAARANDLPLEFFARVIWQESRFQPNADGPVTRNSQRAQRRARARAAAAAELHAADGAAQAGAQSVRRQARGAGDLGGRQSLGRPAQRRLLARPRARRLCEPCQAL